jgi:hypothetical protein
MEHIKWLSENGFLEVESRFKQGNQTSNSYTISSRKLLSSGAGRGEDYSLPSEPDSPPLVNVVHPPSEPRSPRIIIEPSDRTIINTMSKNKFSDDDKICAEWLISKLQEFIPDCKTPNLNGWAKSVRDMRELDNRDHKEICQIWLWCRKDSFEAANVQSPEKLRKRYDQLKTKMKSPATGANYGSHQQPNRAGSKQHGLAHDDTSWLDRVFGAEQTEGGCASESDIHVIEGDFSSLGGGD